MSELFEDMRVGMLRAKNRLVRAATYEALATEDGRITPELQARAVDIPVILTGGNRSVAAMERLVREDGIAGFGLCRPLICEPDLPRRWRADPHAKPRCISCNGCSRTPGHRCVFSPRA